MKIFKPLTLLSVFLIFLSSCGEKPSTEVAKSSAYASPTMAQYNNTKGYWENGEIIKKWDCPDDLSFPAIDIRSWKKTPVVNGRFPTYAETKNGTAIHHYGEKESSDVKPFNISLPRLAYHYNPSMKVDDIVVVIQMVQTAEDTIVGYRYLTGGCGGSLYHDFRFLTDEEVIKETYVKN